MTTSSLEAELLAFLAPDETAAQMLARTYVEPFYSGVTLIDHHVPFRPGNVLEVAGVAGSGKTEVLLQIAVTCILPPLLHGVQYGGRGENVLLFDLDCKFDMLRVLQVLHARIGQALEAYKRQPATDAEVEPVVHDCLTRLHMVRCHSSFDFLAALAVVKPVMTHLGAHGGIRCVLIDNVSAYYYLDKVGRGPGGGATVLGVQDLTREGAPLTLHRVHTAMAQELRTVVREHRVAVVATKNLILPGGRDADHGGDMWAHRDFMAKPWQDFVTHRLMLKTLPGRRAQQQQHGGAGGGGPGAAAGEKMHVAKWLDPAVDAVMRFEITDGALVLL